METSTGAQSLRRKFHDLQNALGALILNLEYCSLELQGLDPQGGPQRVGTEPPPAALRDVIQEALRSAHDLNGGLSEIRSEVFRLTGAEDTRASDSGAKTAEKESKGRTLEIAGGEG